MENTKLPKPACQFVLRETAVGGVAMGISSVL